MVRFIILASLIAVALMIYTLIECARTERHQVRSLPKPVWLLLVVILPLIGPVLWFGLGRPGSLGAGAQPAKVVAPDDDEDFLRQLEVWRRQQQREAELNQREEELKRREEQAKDEKPGDSTPGTSPEQ